MACSSVCSTSSRSRRFPSERAPVDAYRRFRKGQHAAALNFGDCMAYAVGRLAREPLLFTCEDFGQTDIEAA
jgi:ribonuclease VapC